MIDQQLPISVIDVLHSVENKVDKAMLISEGIINTYLTGADVEDLSPEGRSEFEKVLLCGNKQYSLYMDILDDYLILIKKEVAKAISEVEQNL